MSGLILLPGESGSSTALSWISAADYGAVGNGATDDTTALRSWCTALSTPDANGLYPVGYLPPGIYITGDLTVTGGNNGAPRIVGAGWSQSILQAKAGTTTVLTLDVTAGQATSVLASVEHLAINGNAVATNGIIVNANVSRTTFRNVQVYQCTGVGIGNTGTGNSNFSTVIDRCLATQNGIGIRFGGLCQDLKIVNSQLYGNLTNQVSLGNATTITNIVTLDNCQIERGNSGTGGDVTNLLIQNCAQVIVRSCYFESHTTAGSNDITIVGGSTSYVYIDGMFATGNTQATSSIVLPNDATTTVGLVLNNARLVGYTGATIANSGLAGKSVSVMDQAGNIGYDTGTPQFPLDIHGSASFSGSLTVGTSSTMGNRLNMVGPGPDINAGSATTMNLNYNAGNGIMVWNGQAGTGHALFRADGPTYDGVQIKGGAWIKGHLSGSVAWTPGAIAAGAAVSTTVAVASCLLGDTVVVGFSLALPAGCILSGNVTATGVVTVTLANLSGASQTINAGTIRADCWEH